MRHSSLNVVIGIVAWPLANGLPGQQFQFERRGRFVADWGIM